MLIMSRGPTPKAFKLFTNSCRLTPAESTAIRRSDCSSTSILVRGTTTVWAPPPGANCTPPWSGACGSAGDRVVGGVDDALGATAVAWPPDENGLGCETCGVSVMRTVRLPCATATVL